MEGFKILEIYPQEYEAMRFAIISVWPAAFCFYLQRRGYEFNFWMLIAYLAFLFPATIAIRACIFRTFFRVLAMYYM